MELVLIRHGQPEWSKDGRYTHVPPLTELGHRQARKMAESLTGERFDAVYVSPLLRARQTAEPLYDALGMTEVVEPWLEEIRDPPWNGAPEADALDAFAEERSRPWNDRWRGMEHLGAERLDDFARRIHAGADEFLARQGVRRIDHELPVWNISPDAVGRRIACVAHTGTNTMALGRLLGLAPTPWEWDRFRLAHGSVTRLVAVAAGDAYHFSLTQLSGVEHLATHERTG